VRRPQAPPQQPRRHVAHLMREGRKEALPIRDDVRRELYLCSAAGGPPAPEQRAAGGLAQARVEPDVWLSGQRVAKDAGVDLAVEHHSTRLHKRWRAVQIVASMDASENKLARPPHRMLDSAWLMQGDGASNEARSVSRPGQKATEPQAAYLSCSGELLGTDIEL
jgi:hypothetical protein